MWGRPLQEGFEAGLQAMCFLYPDEIKSTTVYAKKHFRGKRYRALEFSLHQLINIADELAGFPPSVFAGRETVRPLRATRTKFARCEIISIPVYGLSTRRTINDSSRWWPLLPGGTGYRVPNLEAHTKVKLRLWHHNREFVLRVR